MNKQKIIDKYFSILTFLMTITFFASCMSITAYISKDASSEFMKDAMFGVVLISALITYYLGKFYNYLFNLIFNTKYLY